MTAQPSFMAEAELPALLGSNPKPSVTFQKISKSNPQDSEFPRSCSDASSKNAEVSTSTNVDDNPANGVSSAVRHTESQTSRLHENVQKRKIRLKTFARAFVNVEISNRYDIDSRHIGEGGFGKVFVAREKRGNRKVAIKQVHIHCGSKLESFKNEAEIMKDLDHPNICRLIETYQQGRNMYFVMEYLEGRELFDRIMEDEVTEESASADVARQIVRALKYAHGRGIAHRDIKPENVVFCSSDKCENHIKVIDWGLGFYFGEGKMTSAVGSLSYAAPEVLKAQRGGCLAMASSLKGGYTAACDLWSLGVLTYVMLSGRPPFFGIFKEQLNAMSNERYPMSDATWQATSEHAKVLAHPWLKIDQRSVVESAVRNQILSNMRQFSNTGHFYTMCVASIARQLDHQSLHDVHKVFCELDVNNDGVLELDEVVQGFEKLFEKNSQEMQDIKDIFHRLDLDGSGTIDYTEFCAAGIGERMCLEESTLWCAFKAFDFQGVDDKITTAEVCHVLEDSDVNSVWSSEVCREVAEEIMAFDTDQDGSLDFDEFVALMRECASRRKKAESASNAKGLTREATKALEELDRMTVPGAACGSGRFDGINRAYNLLDQIRSMGRKETSRRPERSKNAFSCFSMKGVATPGDSKC
eukprot:TRINITY_DN9323_c0_g1_i2.p1 TRINITY_DN9323_c0_g1~~TRINITY_DN9323_c0_g1_i2.p1  ORF type:complete len:641 (+),score=116.65 TRINITY_DN9323_c0_g1_i2:99-2021(+)